MTRDCKPEAATGRSPRAIGPNGVRRRSRIGALSALSKGRIGPLAAVGILFLALDAAAVAQSAGPDDLRARQAEVFEALSADPANLELMFAYAVASLRLEDYEAAISTLERMLFFNPNLSRVRLELAVAYYRLGVYDVARFHFESVLADDPPEEVVARIEPFLAEVAERTAQHDVSGFLSVGAIFSSNATLGPPDREVKSEFFPGGVGFLDADADEAADFGARVTATATHRYDLRKANDDAWLTTAEYTGIRYRREVAGSLDALFFNTGPRLALDDEAFGLKARPYGGIGYVRSANEALYVGLTGGLEVTETLTPGLSAFGAVSLEWRDFLSERGDFDGVYGAGYAGVTVTPARNSSFGVAVLARADRAAEAFTSNFETGLRVSGTRVVDFSREPGLEFLAWPWRFSAFAQGSHRFFDAPDPAVDADTVRRDNDLRVGGRALAPIDDSIAVAADVSYYRRLSNIRNFELRNMEVSLSFIQYF